MRYLLLLIGLFSLNQSAFAENFSNDFVRSYQYEVFPMQLDRFSKTAEKIFLAKPSLLERWGIINSDAAASYNNYLNTIILKDEIIRSDDLGNLRLPTIKELKIAQPSVWVVTTGQIFHEMGHAEYDLFVEEKSTPSDEVLMNVLEGEFSLWLKANYPNFSNSQITLSQWEIFGYYRGDLISNILIDWSELLHRNGIEPATEKCVQWGSLKKLARNMKKEDFLKVLPVGENFDLPYSDTFSLTNIYIKGEEVDLGRKNPALSKNVYKALFDHFNTHYSLPPNKRALVSALQNSPKWQNKIRNCHLDIYTQALLVNPQNLFEIDTAEDWNIDWEKN